VTVTARAIQNGRQSVRTAHVRLNCASWVDRRIRESWPNQLSGDDDHDEDDEDDSYLLQPSAHCLSSIFDQGQLAPKESNAQKNILDTDVRFDLHQTVPLILHGPKQLNEELGQSPTPVLIRSLRVPRSKSEASLVSRPLRLSC
jgi:hypothetical protein